MFLCYQQPIIFIIACYNQPDLMISVSTDNNQQSKCSVDFLSIHVSPWWQFLFLYNKQCPSDLKQHNFPSAYHQFLQSLSLVQLFCNSIDYSLPGSSVHGFSRQKYWSELPVSSPGGLLDPGIDPEAAAMSPPLLAGSLPLSHWRSLGYHQKCSKKKKKK